MQPLRKACTKEFEAEKGLKWYNKSFPAPESPTVRALGTFLSARQLGTVFAMLESNMVLTAAYQSRQGRKAHMGYNQLVSVEVLVDGVEHAHQFRIWNTEPESMFFVVKPTCQILDRLKVGDTMKMIYHTRDTFCPTRTMSTLIRHITRENDGPFKGHCLVGLAVADKSQPEMS
jgi:hypothetical protein